MPPVRRLDRSPRRHGLARRPVDATDGPRRRPTRPVRRWSRPSPLPAPRGRRRRAQGHRRALTGWRAQAPGSCRRCGGGGARGHALPPRRTAGSRSGGRAARPGCGPRRGGGSPPHRLPHHRHRETSESLRRRGPRTGRSPPQDRRPRLTCSDLGCDPLATPGAGGARPRHRPTGHRHPRRRRVRPAQRRRPAAIRGRTGRTGRASARPDRRPGGGRGRTWEWSLLQARAEGRGGAASHRGLRRRGDTGVGRRSAETWRASPATGARATGGGGAPAAEAAPNGTGSEVQSTRTAAHTSSMPAAAAPVGTMVPVAGAGCRGALMSSPDATARGASGSGGRESTAPQAKRRMCTFMARPRAAKMVMVADPP